ncbi:hypothetical protein CFC21_108255 [Triticum aestivum]|uniref:Uncharacterized protein n=2 Tax=Triticum aestivum TaxID=4565 RepID=A0A9R1NBB6_WHEAT|nr:hypothetical protein CFC21_108255 [Triticum aestivum]
MRRAIWERLRPRTVSSATRLARFSSTSAQRNCGSAATMAAVPEGEMPSAARKARTASILEGDLRWASFLDALRALGRERPQVVTR